MKKIWTLTLAVVLVLAMGIPGTAAKQLITLESSLVDGYEGDGKVSGSCVDLGTVYTQDVSAEHPEVIIHLWGSLFGGIASTTTLVTTTEYATLDKRAFLTNTTLFRNGLPSGITANALNSWKDVKKVFDDYNCDPSDTGGTGCNFYGYMLPDSDDQGEFEQMFENYEELDLLKWVEAKNDASKIYFPQADGSVFSRDVVSEKNNALTAKEIRDNKLAVRTAVSGGSKAIEKVAIDNKKGRITIDFVEEYVSTEDLKFDFTVYLTIDGKRQEDWGITLVGTLANEVHEVYKEDNYADLSDGYVAQAQDFVQNIEVNLGNGVSVFTKFFKDKKYYGTASREPDEADDVVFHKYPAVDNVVTLKTVGLNNTGDLVKLDTDDSAYYVYNKDMEYLGRSNELLPYSTRYYLANEELDVESGQ